MLHTGDSGRIHPVQQRARSMRGTWLSSNRMSRMTAMWNRNYQAQLADIA